MCKINSNNLATSNGLYCTTLVTYRWLREKIPRTTLLETLEIKLFLGGIRA